jgi:hypothetical protein
VEDILIIEQTRRWVEDVVVGCNFCPFARKELKADSVRYRVEPGSAPTRLRQVLIEELRWLDHQPATETTLIILPAALSDFEDYLDFVDESERLLVKRGYEGVYQLASFHPEYCFSGSSPEDAANYTNRSLYPMIHLLREASVERAVDGYPDPEGIPERNIEAARARGSEAMEALRQSCRSRQLS